MSTEDLLDHYRLEAKVFPESTMHALTRRNRRGLREQVQEKWNRTETLGRGAFGHVWKEERRCQDGSLGDVRAVKCVQKHLVQGFDFKREILALAKLDKYRQVEVFVSFLGWFETDKNVFLVMEYFVHGDLSRHISDVSTEDEVRQIVADLLAGLKIMHAEGFTHRDLKPQNVFVVSRPPQARWWIKLGDFGISKRVKSDNFTRMLSLSILRPMPETSNLCRS